MSNLILLLAATALIAIATAQFTSVGISFSRTSTRARRRRLHTLKNYRSAAEIARLDSELQASSAKRSNLDWRIMEVAEVCDESADCRSFYLVDPYQQPLPDFRPGQYLMVRPATAGAFQTTRCYSLSSSPDSRYWRITVKRQELSAAAARSTNAGLSVWLHENIQAGDCLLVGGPNGHFFLPADNQDPLVLMAAGVGITPMASMLRWSMENTPDRPVVVLYQAKDMEHWPLGKSMHAWLSSFPQCRIVSYFSRQAPEELELNLQGLPGEWRSGKFTAQDALDAIEAKNCCYYFCGPDAWMKSLRDSLSQAGVSPKRLHWESFGGDVRTEHSSQSQPSRDSNVSYSVNFDQSGTQTRWSDPEQTLWELAREHDVALPSGCLSGVCGSCKVRLLSGQVAYDREIAVELDENECLSCVAIPKSDLRVDA